MVLWTVDKLEEYFFKSSQTKLANISLFIHVAFGNMKVHFSQERDLIMNVAC